MRDQRGQASALPGYAGPPLQGIPAIALGQTGTYRKLARFAAHRHRAAPPPPRERKGATEGAPLGLPAHGLRPRNLCLGTPLGLHAQGLRPAIPAGLELPARCSGPRKEGNRGGTPRAPRAWAVQDSTLRAPPLPLLVKAGRVGLEESSPRQVLSWTAARQGRALSACGPCFEGLFARLPYCQIGGGPAWRG
jgi:hypothetical protein